MGGGGDVERGGCEGEGANAALPSLALRFPHYGRQASKDMIDRSEAPGEGGEGVLT